MKKVLLTGSNGFVGLALKQVLLSKGFQVIETGNSTQTNLCAAESVNQLPTTDIIIHLAAKNFIPESFQIPGTYYHNNIVSTINILEKARIDKSRVIFLSTYVYGTPSYLPIDEKHTLTALNPYTQTKIIGEELCAAYSRDYQVPVMVFRPFNIYGPKQSVAFFIPKIIAQLNNEFIDLSDPRPRRDFIHIDDVVNAILTGASRDFEGFHTYNLGSGSSTPVKEVVEMMVKLSGSKAEVRFSNEMRQGEVLDTVADLTLIQSELNWKPQVTLVEGLKSLVADVVQPQ